MRASLDTVATNLNGDEGKGFGINQVVERRDGGKRERLKEAHREY